MNLLEINDLSKRYCTDPKLARKYATLDILREAIGKEQRSELRPGEFWALKNVSLHVAPGEVVGVIGHNGAGKSTLINVTAGVLRPTTGTVRLNTPRVVVMDHQGSLSPIQTGKENIGNQLALHGLSAEEIGNAFNEIIAYSDLGEFIDAPVGTYSLGMRVRLSFSIYSFLRPDLFLVDEALNGGDLKFRMKFQRFLHEYVKNGGAILLASHDFYTIHSLCHRCILMDYGQIRAEGLTEEIISLYTELVAERDKEGENQRRYAPESAAIKTERTEPAEEAKGKVVNASEPEIVQSSNGFHQDVNAVRFDSLQVIAADGGALTTGEPAEIVAVVHSKDVTGAVYWGIELGTAGAFPATTLIGGYGAKKYCLVEGRNEFRCRIERLPLLPGTHIIESSVLLMDGGIILASIKPAAFSVTAELDTPILFGLNRNNIFYIPAEWE